MAPSRLAPSKRRCSTGFTTAALTTAHASCCMFAPFTRLWVYSHCVGRLARPYFIVGELAAWRGPESFSLANSWLAFGREPLRTSPCLSKVKGLLGKLQQLHDRLDRDALRVRRPEHTIFLCGGFVSKNAEKAAFSVRDYLVRLKPIKSRVTGTIVLAETAQQLYRDTTYPDLISFEEDVARVSSIVLVISESPGALAELGAFASEPVIRPTLRVLINEEHASAESFVRYGPIKRIEDINREHIGVFPWKTHKSNGRVVKASISEHYREIVNYINERLAEVPKTLSYYTLDGSSVFYDIIWILSLLEAVPPVHLYDAVRIVHPHLTDGEIRNKIYILKTVKWLDTFSYSGKDYHYLPENRDPYIYSFLTGQRVRDIPSMKIEISQEFIRGAKIGRKVMKRLVQKRSEVK